MGGREGRQTQRRLYPPGRSLNWEGGGGRGREGGRREEGRQTQRRLYPCGQSLNWEVRGGREGERVHL